MHTNKHDGAVRFGAFHHLGVMGEQDIFGHLLAGVDGSALAAVGEQTKGFALLCALREASVEDADDVHVGEIPVRIKKTGDSPE